MGKIATLGHATLQDSLNASYRALAEAFLRGSSVLGVGVPGVLTSDWVDDYLPGEVFDLAMNAGWIATPVEIPLGHPEEGEMLGNFAVGKAYRDWFLNLLNDSLSRFREIAAKNDSDANARDTRTAMESALFPIVLEYAVTGKATPAKREADKTPSAKLAVSYKEPRVPETTSDERKALEETYRSKYMHPYYGDKYLMKELHELVIVHRKQWDRWRQGLVSNNSDSGRKILDLLERNKPKIDPNRLGPRTRE